MDCINWAQNEASALQVGDSEDCDSEDLWGDKQRAVEIIFIRQETKLFNQQYIFQ